MDKSPLTLQPGVLNGPEARAVFADAKIHGYALLGVNCIDSGSVNAVLHAASEAKTVAFIQASDGGATFFGGKPQGDPIAGAIRMAYDVHRASVQYGVPVILHTDHASRKKLPWLEGLIAEGEKFYARTGRPLFTSHMVDLSDEELPAIIKVSQEWLTRLAALDMMLETEVGPTGGEEDGVDNSALDTEKLYTTPEDIATAFLALNPISSCFTIAAAFGNVHGVYKPGNVVLKPSLLGEFQAETARHLDLDPDAHPVDFVFHGGSGSSQTEIDVAIANGVVKMNYDTGTQAARFHALGEYVFAHPHAALCTLHPVTGDPLKKQFDPRAALAASEAGMTAEVLKMYRMLNCNNILAS